MNPEEPTGSLADQAAAWVPPWQRPTRPPVVEEPAEPAASDAVRAAEVVLAAVGEPEAADAETATESEAADAEPATVEPEAADAETATEPEAADAEAATVEPEAGAERAPAAEPDVSGEREPVSVIGPDGAIDEDLADLIGDRTADDALDQPSANDFALGADVERDTDVDRVDVTATGAEFVGENADGDDWDDFEPVRLTQDADVTRLAVADDSSVAPAAPRAPDGIGHDAVDPDALVPGGSASPSAADPALKSDLTEISDISAGTREGDSREAVDGRSEVWAEPADDQAVSWAEPADDRSVAWAEPVDGQAEASAEPADRPAASNEDPTTSDEPDREDAHDSVLADVAMAHADESGDEGGRITRGELKAALEAILLVVDEPVSEETLAQVLGVPVAMVGAQLAETSTEYTAQGRGFDLRRIAGGWRLYTRGDYAAYVERFVLDGQSVRLTQAALETLAVIAYQQPVTRSRISAIRGVNCDGVIRTLVTRGLIEECGTQPESGAFLYRTTSVFLEKLGLDSVDELPPLAPFLPDDVNGFADAQR